MPDVEWTPGFEQELIFIAGMPATLRLAEETLIRAKTYAPAPVHDNPELEFRRATAGTRTKLGNLRAVGNPRPSVGDPGLRGSLHIDPLVDGYRVGTDIDYGLYQEVGTRKMEAAPYLVPALDAAVRFVQ